MPAKSQKQRGFLEAKFGHEWVKKHHFDNKGKLPKYAHKSKKKKHESVGDGYTGKFY
jgi:hypothetical protein